MRSPFPGMDPFIESFGLWEDFHSKLIGEMERLLSSLVPDRYVVRTGERAYVAIGGPSGDEGHEFLPDIMPASVRGPEAGGPTASPNPGPGEPEAAPVLMHALFQAEYREIFLEIYQTLRCAVWPAHFLRPLPPLSIPLASPDPDVTLALQPLVEAVYARSQYDRDLDYSRPLHPPLCPADAAWLQDRLGERCKAT